LLHFGVQKETEIVQCIAGCTILSSLVIAITCNKRIAFNLRWAFSGYIVKRVRGLVMASGYNWFFESTVWVRAQCDIWLVAGLLQPENVRDYSVGLRIASATIIPTSTLSLAASAKYGMVKNSVESIVSCINTLRIQTLYIGLSVLILLWIIGGRVISSILHFNGGDAIWITHVLSLGLFICILIGPGNQLLQINQCERVLARTTLIALLIHIPAAAIAGSIFGVYGVVFESVLLYILQNVLVARNVKSCLKIRLLSIRAA
jgi:O-antigen/teichoic acid export membrane protein